MVVVVKVVFFGGFIVGLQMPRRRGFCSISEVKKDGIFRLAKNSTKNACFSLPASANVVVVAARTNKETETLKKISSTRKTKDTVLSH